MHLSLYLSLIVIVIGVLVGIFAAFRMWGSYRDGNDVLENIPFLSLFIIIMLMGGLISQL